MECIQCGGDAKYKCPTCREPYCSVACCKFHKENPCSAPPIDNQIIKEETQKNYEFETDDTVDPEKLKLLEQSKELRNCLQNPHVRKILEILDMSPHPDRLIAEYMQEPIFTEFVDACLNVVESSND